MAMQIVQIDYQLIDQLIQRCANQQSQIQAIVHQLRQTMQALEHGGWQGDAANACFSQFQHEIEPAYQRLALVFAESQCVLKAIAKAFHEAEAQAAALFNAQSEQPNPIHDQQQSAAMKAIVNQFLPWLQTPQQSLIIETIRLIPPEQRQALLQNQIVLQAIRGLPGMLPQTIIASLLEGSLTWSQASLVLTTDGQFNDQAKVNSDYADYQPTVSRHFTQLVNSLIVDPAIIDKTLSDVLPIAHTDWNMNCWEFVLYIGVLSGDLSLAELDAIYTKVFNEANAVNADAVAKDERVHTTLAQGLGHSQRQAWCEGEPIPEGSIVFFEQNGKPLEHVAYATGREINGSPEIISLWNQPNGITSVQFTTIAELNGSDYSITYAPNPWLNDQQPSWYNIETIISS
ncbi:WXG100 family type VII secretion target [Herpetosiphon sp. NSE202]|uniref:WXG100 family type VII secretion target n=1 Tax=Herpetosiphon sp. NSE202 TaxID=3351349 RepID=UPI00363F0AB6